MDRIQEQASKLWDLLFDDETADTYQKALNLTGTLLKEFAQLIWLTLISVFVFGAWFSDTSVKAGKSIRDWIDNRDSDVPGVESKPVAETSKDLLEKGRTSVNQLLNQAREQLGLEPQELAVKPAVETSASAKPAEKPAPMAAQKPPVSAQPAAATAQAQKPAPAPTARPAASPNKPAPAPQVDSDEIDETVAEDADSAWPPQAED